MASSLLAMPPALSVLWATFGPYLEVQEQRKTYEVCSGDQRPSIGQLTGGGAAQEEDCSHPGHGCFVPKPVLWSLLFSYRVQGKGPPALLTSPTALYLPRLKVPFCCIFSTRCACPQPTHVCILVCLLAGPGVLASEITLWWLPGRYTHMTPSS